MSYIESLIENVGSYIVGFFMVLFCLQSILSLKDTLFSKLGLTTKETVEKDKFTERIEELEKKAGEIDSILDDVSELSNNIDKLADTVNEINQSVKSLSKDQEINNAATRETLNDRINQKYKYYLNELNGIPEDELEEFTRLHDAYKNLGGNHTGDFKYNYCVHNLPILPVTVQMVFDDEK